jgi:hypothetical protein
MEYIVSVYEKGKTTCTESCGIIKKQGNREKVIEGVNLIKIQYMHS